MKVGDLVMFTDEGIYAKWFYGKLAIAESVSYSARGDLCCRVRWLEPVQYFDRKTDISDFSAKHFTIYSN